MVPMDVPAASLKAFWDLLRNNANMIGCSVTYPHKLAAFDAMDDCTPRAALLKAVNTVRSEGSRLTGDATDGLAMCAAIDATGIAIKNGVAHVLGAGGGAGIAIVDALFERGISELVISETNEDRAKYEKNLLVQFWPNVIVSKSTKPGAILINATTLCKTPNNILPFNEHEIKCAALICDVITMETPTGLTAFSEATGKATVSGQKMGQCQLDVQLKFLGCLSLDK